MGFMLYTYIRMRYYKAIVPMTDAFKGLADPTRLRIVNLLLHGELCVCHIQRVLGTSQPNVSRHLNYLKHAGLVLDRREGFRVFYRLIEAPHEPLKSLFGFLRTACQGDALLGHDLAQLKRSVRAGGYAAPWRCPIPGTARATR